MASLDDVANEEESKTFVSNVQNANCQKTPHVLNDKYSQILCSKNFIRICEVSQELKGAVNDESNFGDVFIKKILPHYDSLGFINSPKYGQLPIRDWKFNRKYVPFDKFLWK